jgi:S-adenosylmethionine:tRNA ribosyltransferase-isomerase
LIGKKETGGRCEVLVIPSTGRENGLWEGLTKGLGKSRHGVRIDFGQGIVGEVEHMKNGRALIRFTVKGDLRPFLRKVGHIPLPPYIKRKDEALDRDRYQTVFAEREGSIAAPTAGLHFTPPLLQMLKGKGVGVARITLHIGTGTFAPVKSKEIEDHSMESEWVEISEETAGKIDETKQKRRRVVAVGTTTTRALESACDREGRLRPGTSLSSLFIYPPYPFKIIDALITNFHLPRSTLIMLVSAFAGREFVMRAYREAIERKYCFYSYGDAMLVL